MVELVRVMRTWPFVSVICNLLLQARQGVAILLLQPQNITPLLKNLGEGRFGMNNLLP